MPIEVQKVDLEVLEGVLLLVLMRSLTVAAIWVGNGGRKAQIELHLWAGDVFEEH